MRYRIVLAVAALCTALLTGCASQPSSLGSSAAPPQWAGARFEPLPRTQSCAAGTPTNLPASAALTAAPAAAPDLMLSASTLSAAQPPALPALRPSERVDEPAIEPDRIVPGLLDNFHAVDPGRVFRSAQPDRALLEFAAREHGIRTVVNLRGSNASSDWYEGEVAACRALGLELIDVRMKASEPPTPETLLRLLEVFEQAPKPILMHCRGGADRSGIASALYSMAVLGEDAETAGQQLSVLFGHFRGVHPHLIETVRRIQPNRQWIEQEYPAVYAELLRGSHGDQADDD